jgi:hypothetical protein
MLIINEVLDFLSERLETGRGKHSPPASPERVTSEALKRRDSGVYRDESPETPLTKGLTFRNVYNNSTLIAEVRASWVSRKALSSSGGSSL